MYNSFFETTCIKLLLASPRVEMLKNDVFFYNDVTIDSMISIYTVAGKRITMLTLSQSLSSEKIHPFPTTSYL